MNSQSCRQATAAGVAAALVAWWCGQAHAINTISIDSGGGSGTIVDQGIGDLDPDPDEIEALITLAHPQGIWSGQGTVLASGGGNVWPDLVFTDVLIEKHHGGLFNDFISIEHEFDPVDGQPPQKMILDGEFDNLLGPLIGGVELDFTGLVDNQVIGNIHEGLYEDILAPLPFAGMGPLVPPRFFTSQTIDIVFYLDTPGDAIRLFNSAEIRSVPEPASAVAWLGLAALMLLARRRKRN